MTVAPALADDIAAGSGSPEEFASRMRQSGRVSESWCSRFLAKVGVEERGYETPCWIWTGYITKQGYARFFHEGKVVEPHRMVMEMIHGPIGRLQSDHLCFVRDCFNPSHLEVVTRRENLRRSRGFAGVQARRTLCIHGHSLSGENLYEHNGHRYCRTCRRDANQRLAERRAA